MSCNEHSMWLQKGGLVFSFAYTSWLWIYRIIFFFFTNFHSWFAYFPFVFLFLPIVIYKFPSLICVFPNYNFLSKPSQFQKKKQTTIHSLRFYIQCTWMHRFWNVCKNCSECNTHEIVFPIFSWTWLIKLDWSFDTFKSDVWY